MRKKVAARPKIVWLDKSKPIPRWLWLGPARRTAAALHAHKYWSTIWTQTPPWAEYEPIAKIYTEAHARRLDGELVHVDHRVPIGGTIVRGLHWHGNLKIITELENYAKSNHTWEDMPFEQQELIL